MKTVLLKCPETWKHRMLENAFLCVIINAVFPLLITNADSIRAAQYTFSEKLLKHLISSVSS